MTRLKISPLLALCALTLGACDRQVPAPITSKPEISHRQTETLVGHSEIQSWLENANRDSSPTTPYSAGRTLVVAPNGADENAGTEAAPLGTISRALKMAEAGDRILVRAGTYQEAIRFPRSGEPGKPIILEGERGADGSWLTSLDLGAPLSGWQSAPEIGDGVFKLDTRGSDPYCLAIDGKQMLRIHDRLMNLPWKKSSEEYQPIRIGGFKYFEKSGVSGFSFLTIPADEKVGGMKEEEGLIPFWEGIQALYGVHEGVAYMRFQDGSSPNSYEIRSAPAATAITLENQSHIVIRNLAIHGAEKGIVLTGSKCSHNIIENNSIKNGIYRIELARGARENLIQNNELSLGFFGSDDFGAWGGTHRETHANLQSQIRMSLYRAFKHLSGTDSSADAGIRISGAGTGNVISGNHIFSGLKGVQCMSTPNLTVKGNVIHNMSSVGIVTLPDLWNARFHDNLLFDCNINLRIHHYNSPSKRSEYHYRNLSRQPENEGTHIYVHFNDFIGEFSPDQDHPIGIYQNTFFGGNRGLVCGSPRRGIGMTKTQVLNNIISTTNQPVAYLRTGDALRLFEIFDYNWVGGPRLPDTQLPEWFGANNIDAPDQQLWPEDYQGNFSPPSAVRAKGMDLSRPFTIAGKTYPPLPGMESGYFSGSAPDLGYLQTK